MNRPPEPLNALPVPLRLPRVGIVSDRRRLCAAAARPLDDAPALLAAQVDAAGECGVEFFQVREPGVDGGALFRLVRGLMAVARGRVRIVVNDRADVAAATGAGLHLKGTSLPLARLRPWLPAGTWISCAVHTVADLTAVNGADALIAGAVQPTLSKSAHTSWLGMDGLTEIVAAAGQPVFVIGGVTGADWPALAQTGAAGLAAIGWMLPRRGEEPGAAVARAMASLRAVVAGPGASPGITS